MSEELTFRSNLERRVKNLALGPRTPSNALVPLFEAVYNSIHALQDRFGDSWHSQGTISLDLVGLADRQIDFYIQDNGIGLNADNFRSFLTYDSDLKARRGGKGVGRLSWLKVFDHAEVTSVYQEGDRLLKRSFRLVLDFLNPVQDYSVTEAEQFSQGTTVRLVSMRTEYAAHVPVQFDTVLRKLVAHFMPFLVTSERPRVRVATESEEVELGEYLDQKEVHLATEEIAFGASEILEIEHNLLEKGLTESDSGHMLYFSAHGRVVQTFDIGLALGIKTLIERNGRKFLYAGVVSGEVLDENVNVERTAFDLDEELLRQVRSAAIKMVGEVLSPQVQRVISQQADITKTVVQKFPRFAYLVGDPREFVERKFRATSERRNKSTNISPFTTTAPIEKLSAALNDFRNLLTKMQYRQVWKR